MVMKVKKSKVNKKSYNSKKKFKKNSKKFPAILY
jgi:hypothetical protein